jgi:hypothetical protein
LNVQQARAITETWVREEFSAAPGFQGAFLHGSMAWLPAEKAFSQSSDVDIIVVFSNPPPVKLGKLWHRGILLDISYLSSQQLQSAEAVLGVSHLAGSLRNPGIIADPTGKLTQLQAIVSREFAKRQWVQKRCEHARGKILRNLRELDASAPFHDLVMPWVFGAGVTTHILLVAGLKNPTVRRRYVAARELLTEYGRLDFYESLLELLGCANMDREHVEKHLDVVADAFDAAKTVIRTPFPFASDISDVARPIAIDGSKALIERGCHREAVFWIVVTYSRCQAVLFRDAPEEIHDYHYKGYQRLLGDLGIGSTNDLQQRGERVKKSLREVWEVAQAIIKDNPDIVDEPGTEGLALP